MEDQIDKKDHLPMHWWALATVLLAMTVIALALIFGAALLYFLVPNMSD
jgi:hypothetical protein